MASPKDDNLVYNIQLSSVGPGHVTVPDAVHHLRSMDLAMKLHYIKGVYWFSSQAVGGLSIKNISEATFSWFDEYYMTCGRLTRSEGRRPYIKCNDCGARFVEAQCDKTVDEWLGMEDFTSCNDLLVYHKPIGPELSFSPLIFLQATMFKCGGMSLGLSWPHILGDAFSASEFINRLGHYIAGLSLNEPPKLPKTPSKSKKRDNPAQSVKQPLSVKRVNPVGDLWVTETNCKMETISLHISPAQLSNLQSKISGENRNDFECLCAIIWQCIAKFRGEFEPQIVTIFKKGPSNQTGDWVPRNAQIISTVQAYFSVKEAGLTKLEVLLAERGKDEISEIEEVVERDNGVSDFVAYGARLTFVNLVDADMYGFELNGEKPKMVYYSLQGVGDEGAVVVLPARLEDSSGGKGRIVTVTLPKDEVLKLESEVMTCGLLLERELE
ncbi:hypothetical protein SLEP1_g44210 [Rubroshorea leprosula]|uniref:Protein ECERIFERUM 26-like n=1 Tax=Rubroshorea leprosula TaxID=152421 RepID=A0AAV5LG23_9ROSI|nr:hypothetical protein SLEP1_g44210 [Rubroshorea leprosula]